MPGVRTLIRRRPGRPVPGSVRLFLWDGTPGGRGVFYFPLKGPAVWTALWVFILLLLAYLLTWFVRRNDRPVNQSWRSKLAAGMMRFGCETCYGNGAFNPAFPTKQLSFTELMASSNMTACLCCAGMGSHWVPNGGKYRCIRYGDEDRQPGAFLGKVQPKQ
jgi:hypothetical protein